MWLGVVDASGLGSGLQSLGTWTVPATPSTFSLSLSPNSGSGATQTFTVGWTEPNGYATVNEVYFLVNSALNASNGCYIRLWPGWGSQMLLANDTGSAWLGPVGWSGVGVPPPPISNSQCALDPAYSGSGSEAFTVAVTFNHSFAGPKSMWVSANDSTGATSGFLNLGTWTVP
jgi:hypothetical protein